MWKTNHFWKDRFSCGLAGIQHPTASLQNYKRRALANKWSPGTWVHTRKWESDKAYHANQVVVLIFYPSFSTIKWCTPEWPWQQMEQSSSGSVKRVTTSTDLSLPYWVRASQVKCFRTWPNTKGNNSRISIQCKIWWGTLSSWGWPCFLIGRNHIIQDAPFAEIVPDWFHI